MKSSTSCLVIGYLSTFGTMFAGVSSASCTQALQGAIPDFQLSVARSLVQFIIYIIGAKLVGSDLNIKREYIPGIFYLGFAYLMFNVGLYGATAYLPLTETWGVLVISQIATAFLHSQLFFNITITKSKIISLLVCIIGIILTAQPAWLFNQIARNSTVELSVVENISHPVNILHLYGNEDNGSNVMLGYILSTMGGAAMGITYDINGRILKGIKPIVQATYSASICIVGSVACMFYMEDPVLMMDLTQFVLVLGHGVLSTVTSFLFIQSAFHIPGPTLSALYSFQMVLFIIYQYTIMHSIQPGNYNWIEVLGCVVIILGGSIPSLVDILVHQASANELP